MSSISPAGIPVTMAPKDLFFLGRNQFPCGMKPLPEPRTAVPSPARSRLWSGPHVAHSHPWERIFGTRRVQYEKKYCTQAVGNILRLYTPANTLWFVVPGVVVFLSKVVKFSSQTDCAISKVVMPILVSHLSTVIIKPCLGVHTSGLLNTIGIFRRVRQLQITSEI